MKQHIQEKTTPQPPSFIDANLLTHAQLTDPDYRLKSLEKEFGSKIPISCSKCHHCR